MNVLRRAFALLLFVTVCAPIVTAQEPQRTVTEDDLKTIKARVETFFQSLTNPINAGPERAFPELIGNGPLKDRTDEIKRLIEQAATLDQRYGDYSGHDFASSKAVGADLVFLKYLYKGERFPVVFCFTFYRAGPIGGVGREWLLIGLKFDSRIEALEK